MSDKRDFYEVLGIDKNSDEATIKKAYRKLAMKYHPDKNQGDKEAENKFKEINEAYEILSDPQKRERYDRFGHQGVDPNFGAGGFGGFNGNVQYEDLSDLFGDFFGGAFSGGFGGFSQSANSKRPMKGKRIDITLNLNFEEAVFGVEKDIEFLRTENCATCNGSGAEKGSKVTKCDKCNGQGVLKFKQQTLFGMQITSKTCDKCNGKGEFFEKACKTCKGKGIVKKKKKIKVRVPAGVDNEQIMNLGAEGNLGSNGGIRGDVYIRMNVSNHSILKRQGIDLHCEMPITFVQAALGDELIVPTVDGKVKYTIPEGTQSGTMFRLKGKGVPMLHGFGRGDQLVTVIVETPRNLNDKQKQLLRDFGESMGDEVYENRRGFFDKLKDLFE